MILKSIQLVHYNFIQTMITPADLCANTVLLSIDGITGIGTVCVDMIVARR